MTSGVKKPTGWIVFVAAGMCLVPWNSLRGATTKSQAAKNRPEHPDAKSRSAKSRAWRVKGRRRSRRDGSRYRLARLHMEPERVKEIQRALITAGYLDGEPAGTWDDRTRSAMKGYQADIDFANQYTGQIYEERGRGFLGRHLLLERLLLLGEGDIAPLQCVDAE